MPNLALAQKQSFREKLSWKIAYALKPLYFALRNERKPWNVNLVQLSVMPQGSLGRDLAGFLLSNHLDLMPRAEWHDVYHVLFGYATNIRDEACVQFVPVGNGRWILPYLACTFVSAVFFPEYWGHFYEAYKTGKNARKFHDWDFEKMLLLPTQEIRRMILEPQAAIIPAP